MNRISLRPATESDLPLMMAWRSNQEVYKGFYTQRSPLVWEEHVKWFRSRNSDWRTFIVLYEERPVGVVTIGQLDHWSPETGYYIGETTLWHRGIGTEAVGLGIEWIKEYACKHHHVTDVHTTILDNNEASIGIVKNLGFTKGMGAREGESYWVRKL